MCWDDQDLIEGRPTGAVRVSFGYMSTLGDAQAVIRFVEDYFVMSEPIRGLSFGAQSDKEAGTFLLVFVFVSFLNRRVIKKEVCYSLSSSLFLKGILFGVPVAPAIVSEKKQGMSGIVFKA